MRNRKGLQHHPAGLRGRFELEVQPRLADPGFGYRRHDLPMPLARQLGGVLKRLYLALASDKLGQPPSHRALQPRPQRPQPGHFIDVDRLANAFDPGRAERFQDEIPFA